MPVSLSSNLSLQRPSATYDTYAAARVPAINPDAATLRAAALQAGFVDAGSDRYTHSDGSWIALTTAGRVERGVGTVHFRGLPNAVVNGAAAPAAAAPTAARRQTATPAAAPNPIANFTLQRPSAQHGLLAAAQLPMINADSASLKTAAERAGFTSSQPDFFTHTDGSWVALVNGRIERGVNTTHFRGVPRAPQSQPLASNGSLGRNQAVLAFVDGSASTDAATLRSKGFNEQPPNWFGHADGSWVALTASGPVYGVGSNQVNASSFVPPPPPAPQVNGQYTQYMTLPSTTWPWYQQNTALGKLPIMSGHANARATLPAHGFLQSPTAAGGTERWTHPDGTYVDLLADGRLRLGWQQWSLGQLPFNNRTSTP